MIGYYVPHRVYPAGYHCDPKVPLPFAVLGSQKNYLVLHLMCLYSGEDPDSPAAKLQEWFRGEFARAGKKLDMGKACIRFKTADDLALDAVGEVVRQFPARVWIETNEKLLEARGVKKGAGGKASGGKSAAKKR